MKIKAWYSALGGVSILNLLLIVLIGGDALRTFSSSSPWVTVVVLLLCALNLLTIVWLTARAKRLIGASKDT